MKSIVSAQNPAFKSWLHLAESGRERRARRQTLIDGTHLVATCIERGIKPLQLVIAQGAADNPEIAALLGRLDGVPCASLDDGLFARLSPVDTPAGLLAVIAIPPEAGYLHLEGDVMVLDAIQDAGNLGTLLRSAAAAGLRDVLVSRGSAQVWSPKVLRAGQGAHFALCIREHPDLAGFLDNYRGTVVATEPAAAQSLYELDLRGPVAWLFGNEGAGLAAELAARASRHVHIPMPGGMESLNVAMAATVCLFEQVRQKLARPGLITGA
ncbi:MAG: RNA methyltransferase [Rhodocyclaceae bacterium]|nr:RNA methyltransferase [Rhodocyclaceae bacterium]MBX3669347.1 RNA methyltransferase [Rhodocyclaceae bacterium]